MWSAQLDKANREAEFSEAISRFMQVPSRLKVAVDDLPLDLTEHFPLTFQMQVPGKQTLLDTIWMERMPVETTQVAAERIRRRQGSSWEVNLVSDGSLEKSGTPEIMAMMKQLSNISGQLCVLEEQSVNWRQKELFIYSMLVSACLCNMWLWLRR